MDTPVFLGLYLLFPFLKSLSREQYPYNFRSELIDFCFGVSWFYITYLIFIPARLQWWRWLLFTGLIVLWGYFNFSAHSQLFDVAHADGYFVYALGYISTYLILSLFAYLLFSLKTIYKKQLQLEEAMRQKQAAELSGLKAQINPHFLFNTLNTIYGSALNKEDRTADM
ncbi:MAG: histidine kinase, partial [Bacteroidota bacterium]